MNRIYQGRVSRVEVADGKDWKPFDPDPKLAKEKWQTALWQHHELFQDAVNYYIVALASLGTSPESSLTELRGLLEKVWQAADKQGQVRPGMGESLRRTWRLESPPTLAEAVATFQEPLRNHSVQARAMELAGESLLHDLGGDGSIQQGGTEYWPYFCQSGFKRGVTFPREASQLSKEKAVRQVPRLVWHSRAERHIAKIHRVLEQWHFCNVSGSRALLDQTRSKQIFFDAIDDLLSAGAISKKQEKQYLQMLGEAVPQVTEYAGGSINKDALKRRFYAFLVFKHLSPDMTGLGVLRNIYEKPEKKPSAKRQAVTHKGKFEAELISLGDDPIKLVREKSSIVFRAFTALPMWSSAGSRLELYECSSFSDEVVQGELHQIVWKDFDVLAFKEALKVYNQLKTNREKREEKLNSFALKLLVMDGDMAISAYAGDSDQDRKIRARLEKIWKECKGKPTPPKSDSSEEASIACFAGDPRIDRLRRIINDDLAEEYRLTDGRKTPYGLRRRTMKGWGEVKHAWQKAIKPDESFSEKKRRKLNNALDVLRSGDKREQIGSHKLFEALLCDEVAWSIWREPDGKLQDTINKNNWASDPLEAFREYCEIREALEEVSTRPLNFTPADARFSRRLFMFTDACSFGKDRGEYKHYMKMLSVTVPVVICDAAGGLAKQTCRISYSAPRLLRDGIRSEDGAYAQNWVQPMMRALFGGSSDGKSLQELKDAAVQLMPDYDGQGQKRVLLNFPLSLDEAKIQAHIGKSTVWERQFVTWKRGAQLPFLRWTHEFDGKEPHRWFDKTNSFSVLSADLGTRHVAAVAMIECSKEKDGLSRRIGNDGSADWYARYRSGVVLRLLGENAEVFRYPSKLDDDKEGKAFREELYGERGRSAEITECQETLDILRDLGQPDLLGGIVELAEIRKRFSFPELNDKLLVALRRAQGWIATCVSWHWKLTKPEADGQREDALKQLQEQDRMPDWSGLAANGESISQLRETIEAEILRHRALVTKHLLHVTRRILPLRNRDWEWVVRPDKTDCHLLRQTIEGMVSETTKLRGQRGLSIARIEQLSELRRRWQSLNQSLRRTLGERPPTAAEIRNDPIPDPCPDILTKLQHLREQRVNQTAHLILAQALGVRFREPSMSAKSRRATDTHGEYEKFRDPVDCIVVEDLSRYLSYQGRAKSENSRLMQWCHRAITQKLKMLAEVFGIPVLETPAAYSSRFCSLTGAAGFRAAEVGWNDRHEFRWRVLLNEANQSKTEVGQLSDNARFAKELFDELENISQSDKPHRTLLAPQPGGPMFVTAKSIPHPSPSRSGEKSARLYVLPSQADINAAINLALRAVAHPECADIHHRVRTERKQDVIHVRENRRFGKDRKVSVLIRSGDSLPRDRNTNLFYDQYSLADFDRARLDSDQGDDYPYASGRGVWAVANNRMIQWQRCLEINRQRLKQWNKQTDAEFEEEIPM